MEALGDQRLWQLMKRLAAVYDAVMMIVYTINDGFFIRHLPKNHDRKKLLNWLVVQAPVRSLLQAGFDVTGLDLSADMLQILRRELFHPSKRLILCNSVC